jgi:hypothetical protein
LTTYYFKDRKTPNLIDVHYFQKWDVAIHCFVSLYPRTRTFSSTELMLLENERWKIPNAEIKKGSMIMMCVLKSRLLCYEKKIRGKRNTEK